MYQHHVLLAQLKRSADDVALEGSNIRVVWKHDSSALAVEVCPLLFPISYLQTTQGCIYFYNVHQLQEHAYPATVELTDITTVVTNPPCATLSLRSRAELLRDHVKWYGTRILWDVVSEIGSYGRHWDVFIM